MRVTVLVATGMHPTIAEEHAAQLLRERLARVALYLKALVVRLSASEVVCRIKITFADALRASPVLVEGRAAHLAAAADLAAEAVENAVSYAVENATPPRRRRPSAEPADTDGDQTVAPPIADDRAAAPPGRPHRTPHGHLTRHEARATSVRELSAKRPSRKTTRKSANRVKQDSARTGRSIRVA